MIRCIIIDDERIARETVEDFARRVPYLTVVGVFEDAMEAVILVSQGHVDLVFSDVQMPEITGIAFLKSLRNPPYFIFFTGNPGYAAESYELDVVDYILKPLTFERFLKAANKVYEKLVPRTSNDMDDQYLPVKDRHKTVLIAFQDILYVEGMKDYLKIVTKEKDFVIMETMKKLESLLPKGLFHRVQKSYIINLRQVKEVDATSATLRDTDKPIPLGLQYRDEFYKRLKI